MRLQVNVIVGEQVFPGEPFEISSEALAALRRQMGLGVLPAGVTADSAAFSLRRCRRTFQLGAWRTSHRPGCGGCSYSARRAHLEGTTK